MWDFGGRSECYLEMMVDLFVWILLLYMDLCRTISPKIPGFIFNFQRKPTPKIISKHNVVSPCQHNSRLEPLSL